MEVDSEAMVDEMKLKAYLALSVDGYMADADGGVEWLYDYAMEDEDYGYADFLAGVDALFMGRKTFDFVKGVSPWPYDKHVYVLSNTLEGENEKYSVVHGSVDDALARIKGDGHRSIYVDGGRLVRTCISRGALNEITISRMPIILGAGIALFDDTLPRCDIMLEQMHAYENGVVQLRYRF